MPPTAPLPAKKPTSPFRLSPTDEAMLEAVARYQYATVEQWCRWFGEDGKERYLQRRAREMAREELGYLLRLFLSQPRGHGRAPSLFTLGLQGRRHAAALGWPLPQRFRPGELKTLSPAHLHHTALITDVLLSFDLLARRTPLVTIREMVHERFLQEQRFKVRVRLTNRLTGEVEDKPVEYVPDAFVEAIVQDERGRFSLPIVVEADRDTEKQRQFREKIGLLLAYIAAPEYERLFETDSANVAFFVRSSWRDTALRLAEVVGWTEAELRARGLEHEAETFGFCGLDPATTPPEQLLTGRCWFRPFAPAPAALLARPEGGA